ncbi:MAG: hypothetical protein H6Q93_1038 [Nitrospirae bacterium]|nr:hypothetical protein [Nitrospirota bacterium]
MKIKLFCRSILYLFGTFLHEFSHFAVALFFGKPEGFSIVPRIESDTFIFGAVKARVKYKVLSVFIAAAPLIWWVLLLFMVKHVLSASPETGMKGFNVSIILEKLKTFSLHDAFSLWLASQLFWAGRLSRQDIKTCFSGIISPSGLILISSTVLLVHFFRHIRS